MVADEPDEVREVGSRCAIANELKHGLVIDTVDIERERPHSDTDHALGVVKELDGLSIQGEVVRVLIEKVPKFRRRIYKVTSLGNEYILSNGQ